MAFPVMDIWYWIYVFVGGRRRVILADNLPAEVDEDFIDVCCERH
jgi:hypothetical protein